MRWDCGEDREPTEFERARRETVRYHEELYASATLGQAGTWLAKPHRLMADALVAAAMQRCHAEMVQAADDAEDAHQDPALGLRARILAQAAWVQDHPGLYKVMHESKVGMPFKEAAFTRTTAAVQRCMDAGVAAPGDAATVALDLRTAVIGMLSLRINEPGLPWPPFAEQADRFLAKLVGLTPPPGDTTGPPAP